MVNNIKFVKNIKQTSGYSSQCKDCFKAYRKANKDKIKEYHKKNYENNKDKIKKYNKLLFY
jgi:hypothetical protein